MVYCCQVVFIVVFKYWEVDNLQWCLFVFVGQIKVFIYFQVQCIYCVGNNFFVVGIEENYIVILCGSMIQDVFDDFCIKEFCYWVVDIFQIFCVFVNFDVSQIFCVVDFNEVIIFVDLFMGQ